MGSIRINLVLTTILFSMNRIFNLNSRWRCLRVHSRTISATTPLLNARRVLQIGYQKQQLFLKQAPNLNTYLDSHEDVVLQIDEERTGSDGFDPGSVLPDFGPSIPRDVPVVPIIGTTSTPIFPKFIRIIEISDPKQRKLILKNVSMKFPYAGIFVHRDDTAEHNVANSTDELYGTGTFCYIQECVEMKNSIRLLVQGIRRISLDGANKERNLKVCRDEPDKLFWGNVTNVQEEFKADDQTKVIFYKLIDFFFDNLNIKTW